MLTMSATRRSVAFAGAAIAASLVIAPAVASPHGVGGGPHRDDCVTLGEYNRVHPHMTRKAVHNVFDTSGVRTSVTENGRRVDEVRSYDVCKSPDSTVTVSFEKRGQHPWRLTSKTAVFV